MHVLSSPETDGPEIAWGPGAVEGTYHDAARRLHMAVPAEAHLWSKVSIVFAGANRTRRCFRLPASKRLTLFVWERREETSPWERFLAQTSIGS